MKPSRKLVLLALALAALEGARPAQEARSYFDAATVVLNKDVPPFRRMADLDRDGDIDAIGVQVASRASDNYRMAAYKNDGHGVLASTWSTSAIIGHLGGNDLQVAIGKLNGDLFPDFCVMQRGSRQLWLSVNGASFNFGGEVQEDELGHALVLADLDRDGRDDFIWVGDTELHEETGAASSSIPVGNLAKHGLEVLPQDGPGGADVFLVGVGNDVKVFYGGPALGLQPGPVFTHGLGLVMLDSGDIDGDGDIDAVVFSGGAVADYRVLRRTGPGAWTLEPATVGGPAEFLLDVDGDGDLDVLTTEERAGHGVVWYENPAKKK